ncbi:MAG: hypothetical protein L6Q84_35685, partial [Polyangiaceae bacterium]|nr:hypothetical protein [Polyangiaceae bacterium]
EHGVTTTFAYDPSTANLTGTSDTLGRTLAMTYSAQGNVTSVNDGTTTVAFGHDADNRLTAITDALGNLTTLGYAHAGCSCAYGDRVTSLHTPDLAANQKWAFTYDADGRLASVTDPFTKTETYTYNAAGDLIAFQDRKARTTSFGFDQLGRPSTTTDPALRKGTFAYPIPVAGAWTGAAVFAGSPDTQAAPTDLTASLRDGEYQIGLREHRAGGYPAQVEFYRDATFELSFGRRFDHYGRLREREDRVGLPFASGTVFGTPGFFEQDVSYELNSPLPVATSYTTSRPAGTEGAAFTNNAELDTTQAGGASGGVAVDFSAGSAALYGTGKGLAGLGAVLSAGIEVSVFDSLSSFEGLSLSVAGDLGSLAMFAGAAGVPYARRPRGEVLLDVGRRRSVVRPASGEGIRRRPIHNCAEQHAIKNAQRRNARHGRSGALHRSGAQPVASLSQHTSGVELHATPMSERETTSRVVARVRLRATEAGGRRSPVPPVRFKCPVYFEDDRTQAYDCALLLDELGVTLEPGGEPRDVTLRFLFPELVADKLKPGGRLVLWEGRDIGDAEILDVR